MSAEEKSELELEIAHILFIDTVGYSKLLMNEQRELLDLLNQIVRNTECFRSAEAAGKLIRLPTGDGMALVFSDNIEAPLKCALEISKALLGYPQLPVRMGIHTGPVSRVVDVNDRTNIAGAGINIAQRVMNCGDGGHILLSKRAAEDLVHYRHWQPYLHELGEYEVKHGIKLNLVNLWNEELGNREIPKHLKQFTQEQAVAAAARDASRRRKLKMAIASSGLLICVATAAFFFLPRASTRAAERSIAVLPFVDLSQSKDQEYFSDGITEQIINSISKIRGLFVVARTSAFAFKNKNEDIREVGRQLHVSHVLEGSVNRGTGKVRVDIRLVDVTNGYQLWSETYDSNDQDALSLQSDVAQKVAGALQVELHLADAKQIEKPVTRDPEIYDLYLRGRYFLNKRTTDSIQKGRALFEQAVAKDAGFALGHAGIADSYLLLGKIGAITGQEAAALAWPEASSALAIDDQLAEGYVSRGILLTDFEWNWSAAEEDYRKALALDPNSAAAHNWYARHLAQIGRFEEALREVAAAEKHDPLSPAIQVTKAKILFVSRRYDQAIHPCLTALELEPNFSSAFSQLGQAYVHLGDYPNGIEAVKKYVELSAGTGWAKLELAYAYAVAGNKQESDRIVEEVTKRPGQFSPFDMATIRAAWHDNAGALAWLEKAVEQRSVDVIWIRVDPRLHNVQSDQRFREILARMVPRR
jgi:adenylate cyclase